VVKRPSVVLAYEPTGNLDESTRDEIIGLLEKLWSEYGITLILVTHDSTVASRAQRIGLMQNGKLEIKQKSGTPSPAPANRDRRGRLAPRSGSATARRFAPSAAGPRSPGASVHVRGGMAGV
jgi:ABC-type glutathione transport system ATPase component